MHSGAGVTCPAGLSHTVPTPGQGRCIPSPHPTSTPGKKRRASAVREAGVGDGGHHDLFLS